MCREDHPCLAPIPIHDMAATRQGMGVARCAAMFANVRGTPDRFSTAREKDLRVLIADDDDNLREQLAALLARRGYETWEATNGQEVIEWLRVGHDLGLAAPDVLVLDVRMPHQSGVSLLTELRRAGWQVPVVLMTAHVDDEVTDTALVWGAAALLQKPFSTDELETVLLNVDLLDNRARSGPTIRLDEA